MIIKLLGLGQLMRGDDEIGLEIVKQWKEQYGGRHLGSWVKADLLESPGINLLNEIAGVNAAVLVDAVQSGAPGGTVMQISEEDLEAFAGGTGSVHGWGAAETLSLGRQLSADDLPKQIILIGVEAVQFEPGEGLSTAVRAAIPEAVELINRVLEDLLK